MTAGPVFLDSGIFIVFLARSDRYHTAALRLFSDPPGRWYTSLAVVSETYGWFPHRLGEDTARTFVSPSGSSRGSNFFRSLPSIRPPRSRSWSGFGATS